MGYRSQALISGFRRGESMNAMCSQALMSGFRTNIFNTRKLNGKVGLLRLISGLRRGRFLGGLATIKG